MIRVRLTKEQRASTLEQIKALAWERPLFGFEGQEVVSVRVEGPANGPKPSKVDHAPLDLVGRILAILPTTEATTSTLAVVATFSSGEEVRYPVDRYAPAPVPSEKGPEGKIEDLPNRRARRAYLSGLRFLDRVLDASLPIPRESLELLVKDSNLDANGTRELIYELRLEATREVAFEN